MNPAFSGRSLVASWALLCLVLIVTSLGASATAAAAGSSGTSSAGASSGIPVRIAVAPFEAFADELEEADALAAASAGQPDFAKLLAGRLALRDLDRLIAPSAWVAEPRFEPHAEQVRRWAHSAAVDTVIVGRVFAGSSEGVSQAIASNAGSAPSDESGRVKQVEVVVRSGHSGAELYRHQMAVALAEGAGVGADAGWAAALDPLAAAILGDLGADDRVIKGGSAPPGTQSSADAGQAKGAGDTGEDDGGSFASKMDLSGFTSDAPIEINADEAEIVSRGEDRRLIFQNNVRVKQANILLLSDRLEADYRKGESEPRQLIARGHVRIDQGGRKARCDKAVYQREAQRLTCQGHAELVQGCDVVRGETIEFDLAGDQAKVQGAASIVIRPESEDGSAGSPACAASKGLM